MPHPETVEAQQTLNGLQIHRICFHLLWAASRRVLMLSTEKAGQKVIAIPLPWQGMLSALGIRWGILSWSFIIWSWRRSSGGGSIAPFLWRFSSSTSRRSSASSCSAESCTAEAPPPTLRACCSEHIGNTDFRGCIESSCRRNCILVNLRKCPWSRFWGWKLHHPRNAWAA